MKRQKVVSVLAACFALAALMQISCDAIAGPSAPGSGGTDRALHGTWVSNDTYDFSNSDFDEYIITFRSDGTMESSYVPYYLNGNMYQPGTTTPMSRGTYSTNGNSITGITTHVYVEQNEANYLNTTVGWKDRSDYTQILRAMGRSEEYINELFSSATIRYYISGSILTLYYDDWESETYTRR